MRPLHAFPALVLAAFVIGACGEDDEPAGDGDKPAGKTLTIYSSLPHQGEQRVQSEDVVRGIRLALEQAHNRVGPFTLKHRKLDDSTAATGKWEPSRTSTNARQALANDSTIAYIGEFNSGASAISIPLLNEGGILQVSPANTYVGLTRSEGAEPGEPDKYYPTGERTFGRVVPADHIQAAAQATYMREQGCKRLYILNDKEVYGKGLADQVEKIAGQRGIKVLANEGVDVKAPNFRSLAAKIDSSSADCFFYGAIAENKGVQVWKDVYAASPDLKMFGPDGLALTAFTSKLGEGPERNTFLTVPTLDPRFYPPGAQEFFKTFRDKYGKDPEPYAIYGYEAASVIIDAIRRAGDKGDDRQAVVDAFFATKGRDSVLGEYDIDENGDPTLTDYGSNRVDGGELVFDKVIKAG